MQNTNEDFIIIGKIGATHGIRGWIKIHSSTDNPASILTYQPWHVKNQHGQWSPLPIEDSRTQQNIIHVKFFGYDNPESVRILTNEWIAIKRTKLPALTKNEFYWHDLKGLTVIDHQQKVLGKVAYLLATGSNDVLVLDTKPETAIPYLPGTVIQSVDLEQGIIYVHWELI